MDNLETNETLMEGNSQESPDWSSDDLLKRYKEQVSWSKQESERLRNLAIEAEAKVAEINAWSLLDLHNKDPKLAREVAERFKFDSYWWYDNFIKSGWVIKEETTTGLTEDEFEKMYLKRKRAEEHEKSLKKVDKIIWKLDEWVQDKAREYFDKITDGKTLDIDSATEFAEMATLYVNRDSFKDTKYNEWLAMLWSTWLSDTKKVSKTKWWDEYIIRNWKLILNPNKQQ